VQNCSSDLSYSYDQKAAADSTFHRALLRSDLGHIVHILVHLWPSSTIWYWCKIPEGGTGVKGPHWWWQALNVCVKDGSHRKG